MTSQAAWKALEAEIIACRSCPRLVAYHEQVAATKKRAYMEWDYWGKPVPGFGDPQARVMVVGLAPGAHGSNRTGRMFTGDASGDFLFPALHRAGFASQDRSTHRGDGLELHDLFITAACRCAPPNNRPTSQEIENCRPFLNAEFDLLKRVQVIVALGQIGFQQVLIHYRLLGRQLPPFEFWHGALYRLGEALPLLLASYHPSRQNTQTGRLSVAMFDAIWQQAVALLE